MHPSVEGVWGPIELWCLVYRLCRRMQIVPFACVKALQQALFDLQVSALLLQQAS